MLACELKKILSGKLNRLVLLAAVLLAVLFSCFAVGSVRYVDAEGETHTGLTAARLLTADENQWEGELTAEKFVEIVKSRNQLEEKYAGEVPDSEYGKTMQTYQEIIEFIVNVSLPDSEYDENVLDQMTEQQL